MANTKVKTTKLKKSTQSIHFTGIVVTYNDDRHLRECLNSLGFCKQLFVFDLGSKDNSEKIARECGAQIIQHERVLVIEQIRKETISYSNNDWVILLDPDEILPGDIESELRSLIESDPKSGVIKLPMQYYFKGKPLHCTIWGGIKYIRRVFHTQRNEFSPQVHSSIQLLDGFNSTALSGKPDNLIKHYWVDSYKQMFKKHWRYIKQEGEARYQQGERFSWRRWPRDTWIALKHNLFQYKGISIGTKGIFLSLFYSWYVNMSLLSLRRYQMKMENERLRKRTGE